MSERRPTILNAPHDHDRVSDAQFWAQYLREDEGEPMFGFPPPSAATRKAWADAAPPRSDHAPD